MPDFQITSPDGKRYRVTGPEGATQEQAYQILQRQLGAQAPAAPQGDRVSDAVVQFGRGEARGLAGTLQNIGEMLPDAELPFLPERAREARRKASGELREFARGGDTTAEKTGKFVGQVGPFLLQPELGIARAFPSALGRIAESAAVGAEAGGLTSEDPAKGALYGAAAGAVPGVGGAVARGAAKTFGGHLGRHAAAAWMTHMLGMPWWTWPAMVPLAVLAGRATGKAGQALPRVPGAAAGTLAGQAATEDTDGETRQP